MSGKRLLFLGSKDAGLTALQCLLDRLPAGSVPAIVCPEDRADARSAYKGFTALAQAYGIPMHIAGTAKETTDLITRYAPLTVLVHGWYRMIAVAQFPSVDFLGFHYSPLPRYRGNSPLVWQILNGEERLGVSFFTLTEGMDDGDLVDQAMFDLLPEEDISDALRKANDAVNAMLNRFAPLWLAGEVAKQAQPELAPSYCGLRIPEDGRINWNHSARVVHNFIRAQAHPYPGAYTLLANGGVLRIWRAALESREFLGVPGSVVEVVPNAVVVACGTGAIRIPMAEMSSEDPATLLSSVRSLKVRFQ